MSTRVFVSSFHPATPGALRVLVALALPVLALATALPAAPAHAAGVDPLPSVAKALAHVTSYQVTVTTAATGNRPPRRTTPPPGATTRRRYGRGGAGFGARAETITAVRKGDLFEADFVLKGKDATGKAVMSEIVTYGTRTCRRSSASQPLTCQAATGQYGNQFASDPTAAFMQGAGATVFTATASKTINGQVCTGFTYVNQSSTTTASGTIYISRATSLPCQQIATVTTHYAGASGSATFRRTQTITWGQFNDHHLQVPTLPAA